MNTTTLPAAGDPLPSVPEAVREDDLDALIAELREWPKPMEIGPFGRTVTIDPNKPSLQWRAADTIARLRAALAEVICLNNDNVQAARKENDELRAELAAMNHQLKDQIGTVQLAHQARLKAEAELAEARAEVARLQELVRSMVLSHPDTCVLTLARAQGGDTACPHCGKPERDCSCEDPASGAFARTQGADHD